MTAPIIKAPIEFCAPYPTCGADSKIRLVLPLGLPPFDFVDPCCSGLDVALDNINNLLKPLIPFLTILDCALKIVNLVMAVPEALGPPPNPVKIIKLVKMVQQITTVCLPYLLNLLPVTPTAAISFCAFIRDLMRILISLLKCLTRHITVLIEIHADIVILNNSPDDELRKLGVCLNVEAENLQSTLAAKLGALNSLFGIINTVVGVIVPLKEALEQENLYPLTPSFEADSPLTEDSLTAINDVIAILELIAGIANTCALGT